MNIRTMSNLSERASFYDIFDEFGREGLLEELQLLANSSFFKKYEGFDNYKKIVELMNNVISKEVMVTDDVSKLEDTNILGSKEELESLLIKIFPEKSKESLIGIVYTMIKGDEICYQKLYDRIMNIGLFLDQNKRAYDHGEKGLREELEKLTQDREEGIFKLQSLSIEKNLLEFINISKKLSLIDKEITIIVEMLKKHYSFSGRLKNTVSEIKNDLWEAIKPDSIPWIKRIFAKNKTMQRILEEN